MEAQGGTSENCKSGIIGEGQQAVDEVRKVEEATTSSHCLRVCALVHNPLSSLRRLLVFQRFELLPEGEVLISAHIPSGLMLL